jgi:PAS domain S-box-containing protein
VTLQAGRVPDDTGDSPDPALERAPCGFLSVADDGTVLTVNATLLDILGFDRAEVIGRPVERLFGVGTRIFYQTHLFPLMRMHGNAEEIYLTVRTKDGDDIGVLANVVRRVEPAGAVSDFVLMRVRERQKYEDELLRARRTADQARDRAEAQKIELERANEQLESQAVELEQQQAQLQEHAAELSVIATELETANAELRATTLEAERLRHEAQSANRAKSDFLAVMSHELRTPLNAIAGYVQLLEMGIHGPVTDAQKEALSRIGRSQLHLLRLINDVLNLSRLEAGRANYTIEDVAVDDAIAGVLPMIEPQLDEKSHHFDAGPASGLVVRADRDKLQQVLLNLLSNAIKFTPAEGRIAISVEAPAGAPACVLLRVADTGIGIPPDKLDAIFDPFVQVNVSRTRAEEGSGLGLAISRDLARGMGGDLSARSTDAGSTFTLTLPHAAASGEIASIGGAGEP